MIDLTGQRFGQLTAIRYVGKNKHGKSIWEFACDCGNTFVTQGAIAKRGDAKSCGCSSSGLIDLTGYRFGRWTVIRPDRFERGKKYWLCRCDCGTEKTVEGDTLRRGTSTGCIKCRNVQVKHGMADQKIYWVWHGMVSRCKYVNGKNYHNYGGRGITVCDEWQEFEPFYEWAIANGYSDGLTIDRKDNDGNYEPGNCRWVGWNVQSNNKRTNRIIEHGGKTMNLSQWAARLGIKPNSLISRIERHGTEKALSQSVKGGRIE
jgi:hypothetical protein